MGQMGDAMKNPNTMAADPSGFNGSEWAARGIGAAGKGLLQGAQNQSQMRPPQGGQMMPVPMPQQPQVPQFQLQGMVDPEEKKNRMFFGQ